MFIIYLFTGNAIPLDETVILHVSSKRRPTTQIDAQDISLCKRLGIEYQSGRMEEEEEDDLAAESLLTLPKGRQYKSAVVTYIAGYVVNMVTRTIKCPFCEAALHAKASDLRSSTYSLISFKTRGGLIYPSPSVVHLCRLAEKQFTLAEGDNRKMSEDMFLQNHISSQVLQDLLSGRP